MATGAGAAGEASIQPILDAIDNVSRQISAVRVEKPEDEVRQQAALNFLKGIRQALITFCDPGKSVLGYYFYVFKKQ